MMVGPFEDGPKATTTERGDFVIFVVATSESIFAGAIKVMLIWHLFAEAVFCGILEALQNAVVAPAVKVNTLVPSDFGSAPKQAKAKLSVMLGASCLLTLAGWVDDHVRDAAVACSSDCVLHSRLKQLTIIAENSDCHLGL